MVWNESEDLETAIDLLLEAVAISPNYDYALYTLGRRYRDLGRLNEAEHYLKEAVGLNPLARTHMVQLFHVYYLGRKWTEAESYLDEILQRYPSDPYWLKWRGLLNYAQNGDKDTFLRSIDANPEWYLRDPTQRFRSALVARDFEEALKWNEQVLHRGDTSLFLT